MLEYCLACNYLMIKTETMNYTHILRGKKQFLSHILTTSTLFWIIIEILFLPITCLQAQSGTCQFQAGTITLVLSGQSTGADITSNLILTNTSGTIRYVSSNNTTTLFNIPAGNYLAYGITYENTSMVNLAVGENVSSINSCYKTNAIPATVCDCNNPSGTISATVSGQTNVSGQNNKYVLTDGMGKILAINNTPKFIDYGSGVYNIYAVSYDGNGTINGLSVNNNIDNIRGTCVNISPGIGYVICIPEISVTKIGPATGIIGTNYNYNINVKNTGSVSTVGKITVTDSLPSGLKFVTATGNGWNCSAVGQIVTCTTNNTLVVGSVSSVINLTVNPSSSGLFNNIVSGVGGGDDTPTSSNTVTTSINEPATANLIILKVGPSTVTVGNSFDYTLTVNNMGTATTNAGPIMVTDIIPVGLTFVTGNGNGWSCTANGQTVTCTSNNIIIINGSSNIVLTVNPTLTGTVTNSASVIGGGDVTSSGSNTVITNINAGPTPNLIIIKSGPTTATVGTNFTYTLTVNNTGNAVSNGRITVIDIIPIGLSFVNSTGTGWSCSAIGQALTCISNNTIIVNGNNNITIVVNPLNVGTVTNNASVIGGGDNTSALSNDVVTNINAAPTPNLVISKLGPFTGIMGVDYNYTLTINNTGTTNTNGLITVTDALPVGLNFIANNSVGWSCSAVGQTVTCISSSAIIVNGLSLISLTVNPSQTGTYVNAATVMGGGDNSSSVSNSVSTQINAASPLPTISIVKVGPSTGTVGVSYNYTLALANTGTVITNGLITVTDTLSQGLTFQAMGNTTTLGWSCQMNPIVVNNSNKLVLNCQSSNTIHPTNVHNITFSVVAYKTGTYTNQAFLEGGGILKKSFSEKSSRQVAIAGSINAGIIPSNIVSTNIQDSQTCEPICTPFTVIKSKTR